MTSTNQRSPYVENRDPLDARLRTILGLRSDTYAFDVNNLAGGNSGGAQSAVLSPKVNIILGPWDKTEFYLDFGQGFHSNDARGIVSAAIPQRPCHVPQARRSVAHHHYSRAPYRAAFWMLNLQSELVWDGDAGGNSPAGSTQRYGIELANWYTPTSWLTINADYAWSRAYFTDAEAAGDSVPEALEGTFDGGVAVHDLDGWAQKLYAGLRVRYFGPRVLTQDGTIRSKATMLLYGALAISWMSAGPLG